MGTRAPDSQLDPGKTLRSGEWLGLFALLFLAALIRMIAWSQTALIFDDGPVFLYIAEAMRDGHWVSVLQHAYHPLYPAMIFMVGSWGIDPEVAGALISISCGVLGVGFLYGFLRDAFGGRIAWLGAALLAIHPRFVTFTSDVQSDGLYMALFIGSMWAVWRGLARREPAMGAIAGLLIGLAYLTRPEGLGLALIAGLVVLVLWLSGRWDFRRGTGLLVVLGAALFLVMSPYLFGLKTATGYWQLTQKKSVSELVLLSASGQGVKSSGKSTRRVAWVEPILPGPSPPRGGKAPEKTGSVRFFSAIHITVAGFASAARYDVLLLVALGVFLSRGRPTTRGMFLGSIFGLYAAVLFALAMNADYVSRRHGLVLMLPLLGYAGVGLDFIGRRFASALNRFAGREAVPPNGTWAALVALGVIAVLWLPASLEPRRDNRVAMREAAEWLRAHDADPGIVAARRLRIAYYAGGHYAPLPTRMDRGLTGYLDRRGVDYVIIDESKEGPRFASDRARPKRLELLHRAAAGESSAAVFRVRPRS